MYVDSKLVGISLVWTCFKKEHCKYRVFTKGLSYILRNCYCKKHVTKAISQLHDGRDLWCVCVCGICGVFVCVCVQYAHFSPVLYIRTCQNVHHGRQQQDVYAQENFTLPTSTRRLICQCFLRFSVFHFSIYDSSITIDLYVICIEADKCDHCHDYSVLENHYFVSYIC